MTVSYSRLVANGSSFGCFWSILCKWRGSVYKLIWRELLVYLLIYFSINFTYRYGLNEGQQRTFEHIREYFNKHSENIPMAFVLGFYVSLVVKRWWEQYRLLPWPDTLALFVSAAIPGCEEKGRLMRRNIVRYAILAYVITLKHVSVRVKKRFPTLQHIVDAGLMLESEKKIFEMMDERHPMAKYWMPLTWAVNIINRARREAMIQSDQMVQTLLMEMSDIRWRLGSLIGYDNVTVPLVYTQVVTLSVYIYFLSALMGRQFIIHPTPNGKQDVDVYFPIFTVLQFCFYIGWLKVAEVLIGPFGEDDDDIELNWLIDRHIKAAYMIVDEMHEEHPELLKDQYWDEVVPRELPYTVASEHYRRQEPKGSAEFYKVKQSESIYANLTHRKSIAHPEDVYADYESVDTPLVERRKNWFQRQMQRMGSIRSSSTYSSGLFGRTRHNSSVYSNPDHHGQPGLPPVGGEGGLPGHLPQGNHPPPFPHPHKMSIYDRLIGRKSTRRGKGPGKLNMANIPANLKNRPRIPTPDVTKEGSEKENRILAFQNNNNINNNNNHHQMSSLPSNPNINNTNNHPANIPNPLADLSLVQVVLTPIQENDVNQSSITSNSSAATLAQVFNADGSPTGTLAQVLTSDGSPTLAQVLKPQGSPTSALARMLQAQDGSPTVTIAQVLAPAGSTVTAQAGAPGTAALAQAILSPTLSSAGILAPVTVAVTPISPLSRRNTPQPRITEMVDSSAGSDSACGSSTSSTASMDDRSRKASVTSQSRRSEVYV